MKTVLTVLGVIAFLGFAILQLVVGFVGIEHELGTIWAYIATFLCLGLRFSLPITVGSIFGAMYLWGWPWYGALLFSSPGLLFIVPGIFATVLERFKR